METTCLRQSGKAVLANAIRLFEDARLLEEMDRFPSSYALSVLSQEEYGKAFLLYLAAEQCVPWTIALQTAMRNHQCKQLTALLMDYLQRKDFVELLNDPDRFRGARTLPPEILDGIHIIVHEHISGHDRGDWLDVEDRKVHPLANRIARGVLDRWKQIGFYVEIGPNGVALKTPALITAARCREEIERTKRVSEVLCVLDDELKASASFDLPKIVATFEVLTGVMPLEEFNEKHWQ